MKNLVLRIIIDVIGVSCFMCISALLAFFSFIRLFSPASFDVKSVAFGVLVLALFFAFLSVQIIASEYDEISEDYHCLR